MSISFSDFPPIDDSEYEGDEWDGMTDDDVHDRAELIGEWVRDLDVLFGHVTVGLA